jgi:hypothetical protein
MNGRADTDARGVCHAAAGILAAHVADSDGLCRGCLEQWQRLVPMDECTQAAWARQILRRAIVD